jgi:acyl-CoA synthetase
MDMVRSLQKEVNVPAVAVVANGAETASVPGPFLAFADLAQYSPSAGESAQETAGENGHNVSADDPFVLLFTSGTEAEPKGVIHTHNTILFSERSLAQALSIGNDDAVLAVSPLSHATGFLRGVVLPLIAGAKTVLADQFSPPAAMNIICAEKCTFSMGATPFLHDLLAEILAAKEPYDLSHFRFFLCGGAPVPRHLAAQASQIGFKVLAVYGSTESPPHTVSGLQEGDESLPDHDGKPLPGIEVKIVDEHRNILPPGEIGEEASRGPNVFVGYFKQPELTQKYLDKDGWYYSGDLCVLEPDNHLRVVGRKKDMIIRGGQNISPGEIEQMLYKHPKIDKVAVVGIPDERMGEKVAAFVVPAKGETFTFAEMIEFLEKEQIAKYKYPEKLLIVRDLPQTPAGKIQKYKLKNVLIMNTGEPRSFIFEHRLNSGD